VAAGVFGATVRTIGTDWIGPTATKSFSGSKVSVFQTAGPAVTVPLEPSSSV